MRLKVVSAEDVARHLTYERCIPLMRGAMIALSTGQVCQPLRAIVDLEHGNAFGVMPGALVGDAFGAKLVSVFPENVGKGGHSHQGLVVLFNPASGAPVAAIEAGELTAIRTAAASAAATDVLARPEARSLAILGTGEQAWRHVAAIRHVRPIERVTVWGRSRERTDALAAKLRAEAIQAEAAPTAAAAARGSDIVCTTTASAEPIIGSADIAEGTHVNAIGSSRAGPAEIASDLVARARMFADHRESVLKQGGEFLRARDAGLVTDAHVLGEIGEVFAGTIAGRTSPGEVTLYKSLGSIAQDLVAARAVIQAIEGAQLRTVNDE